MNENTTTTQSTTNISLEEMLSLAGMGLMQVMGCGPTVQVSVCTLVDEETGERITLEEAAKQAREAANQQCPDTRPTYKKGKTRTQVEEALYDLLLLEERGHGYVPSHKEELRGKAVEALNRLNYWRVKYGNAAMTKDEVNDLTNRIRKQVQQDLAEETTVTYVSLEVGIEHASWYNDDGDTVDPITMDEGQGLTMSTSEFDWSEMAVMGIFKRMDPEGLGYATRPMSFSGTIRLPRKGMLVPFPARHNNVKESLKWLWGTKGKPGFVSHPGLTKEDREILMDFANKTSLEVYGRYYNDRHFG